MNKRLFNKYFELENLNHKYINDNGIELDRNWGKEIWGITLQIDLSIEIKSELKLLQEHLRSIDSNAFLFPDSGQHISFNQVIDWNGIYSKERRLV